MPEIKFKSKCRGCEGFVIPDARHVGVLGLIEDCTPSNNLEYLEYLYDKGDKK